VEIMPGTEGLVHISELKHGRTEKTEDVVKKGDRVRVKLLERDERGRLRLSMKALLPKPEGEAFSGGGGATGGEGGGVPMAAEGASDGGQSEAAEMGERSERPRSDRGDRPRRPRSGASRGGSGGRSRE
ncbi:MAG TPA: S1 RNA-binding domain-containing protein, partial [Gemmatimonadaceae bacterium]|nr:S1 RNA-binding domain-containing protein [Gemmatimonadaceae bacterium]